MSKLDDLIAQRAAEKLTTDIKRIPAIATTRGRVYLAANSVWNKTIGNPEQQKAYICETAALMPELATKKAGAPALWFLSFVMRRALQMPPLQDAYITNFKNNFSATVKADAELGFQMARSILRVAGKDKKVQQNMVNLIIEALPEVAAEERTATVAKFSNLMLAIAQNDFTLREKVIDAVLPHLNKIADANVETGIHLADHMLSVIGRNGPLLEDVVTRAFQDDKIGCLFNAASERRTGIPLRLIPTQCMPKLLGMGQKKD